MVRAGPRQRPVNRVEARQFANKADEFLAAARHASVEALASNGSRQPRRIAPQNRGQTVS